MHIHGYRFQVVAQGKLGEKTTLDEVKRQDKAGIHIFYLVHHLVL